MSVRNINGLSDSARKWIIASYMFNAKLKIDSLSYIAKYHRKIPTGALRQMIEPLYFNFFIECSAAIDNHIDVISTTKSNERNNRKALQESYKEIEEIYHWRDKFAAHHDLDALGYGLCGTFSDWKSHIKHMKHLLDTAMIVCQANLPNVFKIDYVVHDATAYRLVNRIDRAIEEDIYNTQHPLRNMNMDEANGKVYKIINSVDAACRYLRIKNVLADRDAICCLFEEGINKEETLQKQQGQCIIMNVLYDRNIWVY